MFNMILEGKKRCDIIDRLNELGYKRADGKSFTGTSIDNILRNEKYTGLYLYHYNKKQWGYDPEKDVVRVENALPQIISQEIFDAVQQILKQRVHAPSHVKEEYLLSGKVTCGKTSIQKSQRPTNKRHL